METQPRSTKFRRWAHESVFEWCAIIKSVCVCQDLFFFYQEPLGMFLVDCYILIARHTFRIQLNFKSDQKKNHEICMLNQNPRRLWVQSDIVCASSLFDNCWRYRHLCAHSSRNHKMKLCFNVFIVASNDDIMYQWLSAVPVAQIIPRINANFHTFFN